VDNAQVSRAQSDGPIHVGQTEQAQDLERVHAGLRDQSRSAAASRRSRNHERRHRVTAAVQGTLRRRAGGLAWLQALAEPHLQPQRRRPQPIYDLGRHHKQVSQVHAHTRGPLDRRSVAACVHRGKRPRRSRD